MAKTSGSRSWGRIKKYAADRYQAAYVGPDSHVHYALEMFVAKMDAEAWLIQERKLTTQPEWLPPRDRRAAELAGLPPTFSEYADGWLHSRTLKPRTKALYRRILDKHLLPTLGDRRLPAITPTVVRQWHTAQGPGAPTQRAHSYAVLKTILGTAVSEQLIATNPCVIRAGGSARTVHKAQPATLEELAVITAAMPDRLRLAVLIAAWCGLRQGEIFELRRGDLDLKAGLIRVRRAVARVPGEPPLVGPPKSDAGVRDVAIPPHLRPEFERHLSRHVAAEKGSLLFVGRDSGEQLASSTLYRHFYPAREAASREDLRWHDLRHTGATLAAATGATLSELMSRLGHSTVGAAMRYQHASSDRDQVIAELLSEMVKGRTEMLEAK